MATSPNRQAAGTPAGGQFAPGYHPESRVSIGPDRSAGGDLDRPTYRCHDTVMTPILITTEGQLATLSGPYHPDLAQRARELGGRWDPNARRWSFDARDEARVREMAQQIYGADDSPPETVTVRWRPRMGRRVGEIYLAGRRIAHRPGRDVPVRLGDGVVIVEGRFAPYGGSARYPELGANGEAPVLLEIRDLPAGHPDLDDPDIEIVERSIDREALSAERERLASRIAEIDRLLS